MLIKLATTCAISAYHHQSCEFQPHAWHGVLDALLCFKISPGTPVSSTNKTDCQDITEILLKVMLDTIN